MTDKTREVGVRLSVTDADVATRALQAFGVEGEGALKRIQAAALPASNSLVLLSNGIQKSKEYARDFAVEGAKSFLGPLVAIGSATAAVDLLREAMERAQQVGEQFSLAERLGLTIDQLQGLQATFKESGGDVSELDAALQTFGANLGKPDSPLQQLFKLNGVKISGNTLADLKTFGGLVKNAANEQARLELVTQAMGRGSKEVLDLLTGDMDRAADRAKELGIAFDTVDSEKIKEANAQLADMSLKLDHAKDRLSLFVEPAETATLDAFTNSLVTLEYALNQIGAGNYGEAFKAIGDGLDNRMDDAGARMRVVLQRLKMGTADADLDTSMKTSKQVQDFYGSFGGAIKQPPQATVNGGPHTKLLDPDAEAAAAAAAKSIKQVTDALNLQITNLTETNRQQAINNELSKAHVTAASTDGQAIAALAGDYYDQKKAIDAVNSATSFLAQTGEQAFEGLIDGTKSWQDSLGDVVDALEKAVLQAELLGTGPLAGILGTQSDTTGQTGGLFGSLISLFTGGGNTAPGLSGTPGDLGLTTSFAGGGFTGHGGKYSPAGIVHRGEYVFDSDATRRIGVGQLNRLRGYAGGGMVGGGEDGIKVNVSIVHQPGAGQDSASASRNGNGIDVKALIHNTVAEGVGQRGTPIHRALKATFGLTPQTTRRGS